MRCEDVIRELALSGNAQASAAFADHLKSCPSCQAWAHRAAQLDRLWEATRPAEPEPEVWDSLWSQIARSRDTSTSELSSPVSPAYQNGSTNGFVLNFEGKRPEPPPARARSSRSRRWAFVVVAGLAQAAAIVLVAGLSWRYFAPSKPEVALETPANSTPAKPESVASRLQVVDIEEGHVVVIVAEPTGLLVVDRTPKGMTPAVARLDWYGDERYFAWQQVFNEFEFLAKPKVAMKD